jgi:maltose O-acetyltransferase
VISSEAVLLTATHNPRSPHFEGVKQSVLIHDFAWVGLRALILPGVTLGRGSIVAAGAVVTKSVRPGDTVAGVPARVIASGRHEFQYETNYRRLFH